MKKTIQLQLPPQVAYNEQLLKEEIAAQLSLKPSEQFSIQPMKRSIDARGRNIKINLTVDVYINESVPEFNYVPNYLQVNSGSPTTTIIGAGPAGLFAALR